MRRFTPLWLCLLLTLPLGVQAQGYLFGFTENAGNPGGLFTGSDSETSGWTSVLSGSTLTSNVYSDTVGIPFPFEFYGTPVTHFRAAPNGILTFDTSATNPPVLDEALPSVSLPDMTICTYWDSFATVASSDVIRWKVFGTAPNRQLWLKWHSMTISEASFVYMSAVLEEGTNAIYLVDMWSSGASTTATVGLQQNGTTALDAGPGLSLNNNGSGNADNDYWTFTPFSNGVDTRVFEVTTSANAQAGCGGTMETVSLKAINQGNTLVSGLVGTFSVDGNIPTFFENIPGTYGPGDTIEVTFTLGTADVSAPGPHTITGVVVAVGDVNTSNDSLSIGVNTIPALAIPLPVVDFTGFTGSNLPTVFPGWFEANNVGVPDSGNSSWLRDDFANNSSSPNGDAARVNLFTTNQSEWLISPKFVPTASTEFRFDLAVTDFGNGSPENFGSDDTLAILISDDCGVTYTALEIFDVNTPVSNTGQAQVYDLSSFAGQEVTVAFYASSGTVDDVEDFDVFVDNINIFQPTGIDVGVITLDVPASACFIDIDSAITVGVTNFETNTLDFAVNPAIVTVEIMGPVNQTLIDTLETGTLATGDTATLSFFGDFSSVGSYDIQAYAIVVGDQQQGNDSLSSATPVVSQPLFTAPYSEDFDAFTPGTSNSSPGVLPIDWTRNTTAGHAWIPDANGTGSSGTGPSEDHTSGSGIYMYSEASSGSTGESAILTSSCIDLGGLTTPALEFWYHMYGDDIGTLSVEIIDQSGAATAVWSLSGQQQTDDEDPWLSALVPLTAYVGDTIQLRFISTYGGGFEGDIAIDDVLIDEPSGQNLLLSAITAPSAPGCLTDMEAVSLQIINAGEPVDLSMDTLFLAANLTGPVPQVLLDTITTGTLASFDTLNVTLSGTLDLSATGEYALTAIASLQGDTLNENDTLDISLVRIGSVALPVGTVTFDGFTGSNLTSVFPGWYEGDGEAFPDTNLNSSWVRDDFANNTSSPNGDAAKINLFSTGKREWIVAPPIVADSVTALTYDLAFTDFADQLPGTLGSDDSLMVMVSTDCGANWTPERIYDANSQVSFLGQNEKVLLNQYAGQEIVVAFYATEGTVNDPEDVDVFLDNILISQLNSEDVTLAAFDFGIPPVCGDSSTQFELAIQNLGVTTQDSIPVSVMVNGPSGMITLSDTLFGALACDEIDSLTLGSFNTFAGGTYTFTAIVGLGGDEVAANDTLRDTVFFRSLLPPTFATPGAVCPGDSITLTATDTLYADTDFEWYDVTGTPLGNGVSFNTGPINDTVIFFLGRISTAPGGCPSFLSQIEIIPELVAVAGFGVDSTDDLFLALSDSSVNADSVEYFWGDGTISTTPFHTYADTGLYEVCQAAYSECDVDITCQFIRVNCVPAEGGFAVDSTGDLFVSLVSTAAKADSVKYFFGDGDSSNMANTTHMYADTGQYTVTQIAYHFCGNDTVTQTVSIGCAFAVAGFEVTLDSVGVTLTSTAQNADSIVYDMGDGTILDNAEAVESYTYSQSGTFTICMTVYNICGQSEACLDVNNIVGGIESLLNPASLRLYPNPTSGSFTIDVELLQVANLKIRVLDMRGRTVYRANKGAQRGSLSEQVDLQGLSKGLYLVQVQANDQVITRKLQLD